LFAQVDNVPGELSLAALDWDWLEFRVWCLRGHVVKKWKVFAFEGKAQGELLLAQFAADLAVRVKLETFFLSRFKPGFYPVFEALEVRVLNWACAFAQTDQRISLKSFGLETDAAVWVGCAFLWTRAVYFYLLTRHGLLLAEILRGSLLLVTNNSLELHLKFADLDPLSDFQGVRICVLDNSPQDWGERVLQGSDGDLLVGVLGDFEEGVFGRCLVVRWEEMIIKEFDCFSKGDKEGSVAEGFLVLLEWRLVEIKELVGLFGGCGGSDWQGRFGVLVAHGL
jgi:hypothetical protein